MHVFSVVYNTTLLWWKQCLLFLAPLGMHIASNAARLQRALLSPLLAAELPWEKG